MTARNFRGYLFCFFGIPALITAFVTSAAANPFHHAVKATVRIVGSNQSGTGFLIKLENDEVILATAAHVFRDMKGQTCQVIFRRLGKDGYSERQPVTLNIREGSKPLWKKHTKEDIAIIPIAWPENTMLVALRLEQIGNLALAREGFLDIGKEVAIPCYPISTESNKQGWPVLRRGTVASYPLVPLEDVPRYFVDSSSYGGESGAPVFMWQGEEVIVVGVVTGMQRQTEKVKNALEEKTTYLPLGLGIVIQAPLLRELLEKETGTE